MLTLHTRMSNIPLIYYEHKAENGIIAHWGLQPQAPSMAYPARAPFFWREKNGGRNSPRVPPYGYPLFSSSTNKVAAGGAWGVF